MDASPGTSLGPQWPGVGHQATPAGMTAVDRLVAYEEIRQLAASYAVAVDSRNLDALVALYVDDVRVGRDSGGRDLRGREALRARFAPALGSERVSILSVGTHMINLVDADHATGVVYCTCEMGDEGRWMRQAIAYHDDYRRRGDRWYFARRRHELFYGVDVGLRPLAQQAADWPSNALGRGTVPFAWVTWQAFQEHRS